MTTPVWYKKAILLFLLFLVGIGLTLPLPAQPSLQTGIDLLNKKDYESAAQVLSQVVQSLPTNSLNRAIALGNLSLAQQNLGRWTEAQTSIQSSLTLLSQENSPEQKQVKAQSLDIQGNLYFQLGQFSDALQTWQKSGDIYKMLSPSPELVQQNLLNQGQALYNLGLNPRACTTLLQIVAVTTDSCEITDRETPQLQAFPNTPLKLELLQSLSRILRTRGQLEIAQKLIAQTLIEEPIPESPTKTRLVCKTESLCFEMGSIEIALAKSEGDGDVTKFNNKINEAVSAFDRAADLAQSPAKRVRAQINLLRALLERGQQKDIEKIRSLKQELHQELPRLPLSYNTLYYQIDFAQTLLDENKEKNKKEFPPTTQKLLTDVLDRANRLLESKAFGVAPMGVQRVISYAYGLMGSGFEQQQDWTQAQKFTNKAIEAARSAQALDIAYLWHWQQGRIARSRNNLVEAKQSYSNAYNVLEKIRTDLVAISPEASFSFRNSIEPIYREYVSLLLPRNSSLKEDLAQARAVVESLNIAELNNFFQDACLNIRVNLEQALSPDTLVIYPILLDDRLETIVSSSSPNGKITLKRHTIDRIDNKPFQRQEFGKKLTDLAEGFTTIDSKDYEPVLQQVYQALIAPIDLTGAKTLVFILDGELRNIPMAALYDGKQYLIENYGIAVVPSLQLLDSRPVSNINLQGLAAGLSKTPTGFPEFPPLDYVNSELSNLKELGIVETPLENQNFTRQVLAEKLRDSNLPLIHLATHGEFSSKASNTFLLAWDDKITIKDVDQALRSIDTSKRQLELLVLSACETAKGDKQSALGLAGMAIKAGARSTLATLWKVQDETTAEFMKVFYGELRQGKTSRSEAVRTAQLAIKKKKEKQHPFFWAPYVLLGNWS